MPPWLNQEYTVVCGPSLVSSPAPATHGSLNPCRGLPGSRVGEAWRRKAREQRAAPNHGENLFRIPYHSAEGPHPKTARQQLVVWFPSLAVSIVITLPLLTSNSHDPARVPPSRIILRGST
jgi:hypothetical protein